MSAKPSTCRPRSASCRSARAASSALSRSTSIAREIAKRSCCRRNTPSFTTRCGWRCAGRSSRHRADRMSASLSRQIGGAISKAIPVLVCVALWQAITTLGLTDPAYLPGLGAIGAAFYDLAGERTIYVELGVSLLTAMAGLATGIAIGVPLGTAMALSKTADGFFGPLIKATYSLPKSALIPLFVLWFGVGGVTNVLAAVLT